MSALGKKKCHEFLSISRQQKKDGTQKQTKGKNKGSRTEQAQGKKRV